MFQVNPLVGVQRAAKSNIEIMTMQQVHRAVAVGGPVNATTTEGTDRTHRNSMVKPSIDLIGPVGIAPNIHLERTRSKVSAKTNGALAVRITDLRQVGGTDIEVVQRSELIARDRTALVLAVGTATAIARNVVNRRNAVAQAAAVRSRAAIVAAVTAVAVATAAAVKAITTAVAALHRAAATRSLNRSDPREHLDQGDPKPKDPTSATRNLKATKTAKMKTRQSGGTPGGALGTTEKHLLRLTISGYPRSSGPGLRSSTAANAFRTCRVTPRDLCSASLLGCGMQAPFLPCTTRVIFRIT